MTVSSLLPGTESQPHAAAVLCHALAPGGSPSHAYLFHGPPGSGKRRAAAAFAAALIADRAGEAQAVRERVLRRAHPDLTWVTPSGAAEMLVADIEEPVVAAAARTPFEAARRVFVIEGADLMGQRPANMMLKTLEEPPSFAHLLLLADRASDVLPTVLSRCQLVRFDPLPAQAIEAMLLAQHPHHADSAQTLAACARLALGDASIARRLLSPPGARLRAAAEVIAASLIDREEAAEQRPWLALLQEGREAGSEAAERARALLQEELTLLPQKERRRREREGTEAARRLERRARTEALQLGMRLLELWLRDLIFISHGAPQLIHNIDRAGALELQQAVLGQSSALAQAVAIVSESRIRLRQNVAEELALEAMITRLRLALRPRHG